MPALLPPPPPAPCPCPHSSRVGRMDIRVKGKPEMRVRVTRAADHVHAGEPKSARAVGPARNQVVAAEPDRHCAGFVAMVRPATDSATTTMASERRRHSAAGVSR